MASKPSGALKPFRKSPHVAPRRRPTRGAPQQSRWDSEQNGEFRETARSGPNSHELTDQEPRSGELSGRGSAVEQRTGSETVDGSGAAENDIDRDSEDRQPLVSSSRSSSHIDSAFLSEDIDSDFGSEPIINSSGRLMATDDSYHFYITFAQAQIFIRFVELI